MYFSIDSNIIIGVANTRDRLHEKSIRLMKDKQNDELIICMTALKESQNIFRNKINQIMVEIIQFLPNFQKKMTLMEAQEQIIIIFRNLESEKPEASNFLKLVYAEILDFLKENNSEKLPSFLSKLALEFSNSLIYKIEQIHDFEVIMLNRKNLEDVKKSTVGVYFKDNNDEKIFQEFMTNLVKKNPLGFFSDDKEFIKNIKKSYLIYLDILGYKNESFSCHLLED